MGQCSHKIVWSHKDVQNIQLIYSKFTERADNEKHNFFFYVFVTVFLDCCGQGHNAGS